MIPNDVKPLLQAGVPYYAVSQREGPGGATLDYLEGWFVIEQMNVFFGFDGWADELISLEKIQAEWIKKQCGRCKGSGKVASKKKGEDTQTCPTCEGKKEVDMYSVFYRATTKVTIGNQSHTGTGTGTAEMPTMHGALDLAIKEAETDSFKRACRKWGNQFGNGLYDTSGSRIAFPDEPAEYAEARKSYVLNCVKYVISGGVLPELKGSDAQVNWATGIRDNAVYPILNKLGGVDGLIHKLETVPNDPMIAASGRLAAMTSASWWINNKDLSVLKLLAKVAMELGFSKDEVESYDPTKYQPDIEPEGEFE